MYFASVILLGLADPSRDHLQLMYHMLFNCQKKYVTWPILSVNHVKAVSIR